MVRVAGAFEREWAPSAVGAVHGFPFGAALGVVEIAAPKRLGGATTVALAAVRAALERDARNWCAWVDPEKSLYAPGVALAGVDLRRLLVVCPSRAELPRIAVKVARSGAFEAIVIDADPVGDTPAPHRPINDVAIRKLALVAEKEGATIFLLSDSNVRRTLPWPVSIRLEVERANAQHIQLRIAKDRHGRIGERLVMNVGASLAKSG